MVKCCDVAHKVCHLIEKKENKRTNILREKMRTQVMIIMVLIGITLSPSDFGTH